MCFYYWLLNITWSKTHNQCSKEKDRINYIRQIKPFFVLESLNAIQAKTEHGIEIKVLQFLDDTYKGKSIIKKQYEKYTHFHLDTLCFSNVSENVCIVEYLKINNEEYKCCGNTSIKAGEMCYITGHTSSLVYKKAIQHIAVGVYDIQYHLYEFNIEFCIEDIDENPFHDGLSHKRIKYTFIDCNTRILE